MMVLSSELYLAMGLVPAALSFALVFFAEAA